MATREEVVADLAAAVDRLHQDPAQPVHVRVDDLVIELRVERRLTADDLFAEVGPWEGEPTADVLERIRKAREEGGSKAPPVL